MPLSRGSVHLWKQECTVRHLGKSPGKARQEQPVRCRLENGTKNIVQVHQTWRCAFTGTFQQGKEGHKLLATDIAWVGFSVHADSLQQKL